MIMVMETHKATYAITMATETYKSTQSPWPGGEKKKEKNNNRCLSSYTLDGRPDTAFGDREIQHTNITSVNVALYIKLMFF